MNNESLTSVSTSFYRSLVGYQALTASTADSALVVINARKLLHRKDVLEGEQTPTLQS